MKTLMLLLLTASTLALAVPIRADGFIVINHTGPVPIGHFSFAPLEVSYHHVNVKIDGQICTTTVDEEFYNPNPQVLEGTVKLRVPPAGSEGPPNAPVALRVSATRHGVTG